MEDRQSKCNYCIHVLLGCSHFQSCAFKSEYENSTLALLQRFVGLVLLELSEFMCIFSVGKLFFMCGAGDDASYVQFGETKDKYFNRSLRHGTERRHRYLRSDSVHTGSIGTGVMFLGFGTQPYAWLASTVLVQVTSTSGRCPRKTACDVRRHHARCEWLRVISRSDELCSSPVLENMNPINAGLRSRGGRIEIAIF